MKHLSWFVRITLIAAVLFGLAAPGGLAQEATPTIEDLQAEFAKRTRRARTPLTLPSMRGCTTSIGGSTRQETVGRTSRPSSSRRPLPVQSGSSAARSAPLTSGPISTTTAPTTWSEFGFGDIDIRIMNIPYMNPAEEIRCGVGCRALSRHRVGRCAGCGSDVGGAPGIPRLLQPP